MGSTEPAVDISSVGGSTIPEWSPNGEWIAVATPGEGITLISPDGARRRLLPHKAPFSSMTWSANSRTIYAVAPTRTDGIDLLAIDVTTGAIRVTASYGPGVRFETFDSPALRMSLGPDGTSLLTTRVRTNTDLWILDNFLPPAGWRARLGWD